MTMPNPEPTTGIRVWVTSDFQMDGVKVFMGVRYSYDHAMILRFDEHGHSIMAEVDPMIDSDPTFKMQDEFARALLDALLRHYQGASDMQTVRSDYLHERDRVDKLIATISDIAEGR